MVMLINSTKDCCISRQRTRIAESILNRYYVLIKKKRKKRGAYYLPYIFLACSSLCRNTKLLTCSPVVPEAYEECPALQYTSSIMMQACITKLMQIIII